MDDIIFLIKGNRNGEPFAAEMYQGGEQPHFTLRWQEDEGELHIRIIPKEFDEYGEPVGDLTLESVTLTFPWKCRGGKQPEQIFMNGYQSWTDSHEHTVGEKEPAISPFASGMVEKYYLDRYGDSLFTMKGTAAGQFHGFTYCYFRDGVTYRFVGSLSERSGFTVFYYNADAGQMSIEKDCAGVKISGEWNAFDLVELTGGEDQVFDTYFEKMNIAKPKGRPMTGYTSWYNHYQNISAQIISDNLEHVHEMGQSFDAFQIDDGYQTYVGDWLNVQKDKFPDGLEPIVDQIHEYGMKAGLWLSPFVCEKKSRCFRKHPDWLVRDVNGEPFCGGSNWSTFYALDLSNEEVREYLREVFHQVLDVWGFDLVKLDFLYAVCMLPTEYKTRGQIMCEAMDFLREVIGDKLILGCGVPLGPAFGKVDYCRIGPDVGLNWDGAPKEKLLHRERVSTKNTIGNTIYRRQLNGRAFWNDPDVYLLRDDNIRLSAKQKEMLAQVNGLFGGLLFTSDDVGTYDEEKRALQQSLSALREAPRSVERKGKYTIVRYQGQDGEKELRVKL